MKKKYIEPSVRLIISEVHNFLCCASGEHEENPYWKPQWEQRDHTEDPNPYWHGNWGDK